MIGKMSGQEYSEGSDDLEKFFSGSKINNDEKQENDSEAPAAPTVKHHDKREAGSQHDEDTDYAYYPKCGSLSMHYTYKCYCGNTTQRGISVSEEYC